MAAYHALNVASNVIRPSNLLRIIICPRTFTSSSDNVDKKIIVAVAAVVAVVVIAAVVLFLDKDEGKVVITFDGNGGADYETGETRMVLTQTEVINPVDFHKDGMIAFWWNTEADGSGTSYYNGDTVDSSITPYAQYAYPLNVDKIVINETITMDGSPLGESQALSQSGTAVIHVEKGDGADWTVSDNGFERVEDGTPIYLEFVFVGAEAEFTVDEDGSGVVTFTYSGPVTLSMTSTVDIL